MDFQSPLHRGSLWNRLQNKNRERRGFFQSPLHRGSLWNNFSGMLPQGLDYFQSPLHRGSLWNPRPRHANARSNLLSVPSSSGKSLELPTSPHFERKYRLSVPSSSGKSLEPRARLILQNCDLTFSPLFIGEVSGTQERSPRSPCQLELSVPSSSGKSLEPRQSLCSTIR